MNDLPVGWAYDTNGQMYYRGMTDEEKKQENQSFVRLNDMLKQLRDVRPIHAD